MRLVKGGADGPTNVVSASFSGSGNSLFYARTFYELPLPALLVQVTDNNRIADANKQALKELALKPKDIMGAPFNEMFSSSVAMSALVGHTEAEGQARRLALSDVELVPQGSKKHLEIFGLNTLEAHGHKYLILLFKPRSSSTGEHGLPGNSSTSFIDPVTGMPNTLAAERKLEMLCSTVSQRSRDLAVALFSLEGWRTESGNYSPKLADDLMAAMASRLLTLAREGVFIARYRSDEFLVTVNGRGDFREVLDRIFTELTREFVIHGFSFTFSVNAGVYVRDIWEALLAEELLAKARKAALRAKLEGGNRFVVYRDKMEQHHPFVEQIEEVIDGFRRGEFSLYYQPVVSFETGAIDFAEGLLRWTHPQKGVQRPVDFLESIEDMAVYDEIGLWVLDLALATLERWSGRNITIGLCINISARQLADELFVNRALAVISHYNEEFVNRLSIDVINLDRLADARQLAIPLRTLGARGVRFSLDDFGAGDTRLFSSAHLTVSNIKISQSYVSNLDDDLGSMFIVQNIVEFASGNDVSVYAKGVETSKQYNLLRALGCAGAQGYAISRPLSEADFTDYLSRYSPGQMAELESEGGGGENQQLFSFALTEHKPLLKEMLAQTINRQTDPNQRKSDLNAFLEAVNKVEGQAAGCVEKQVQLKLIKHSVRRLLSDLADASGRDGENPTTADIKNIVLVLSELIVAVNEITEREG